VKQSLVSSTSTGLVFSSLLSYLVFYISYRIVARLGYDDNKRMKRATEADAGGNGGAFCCLATGSKREEYAYMFLIPEMAGAISRLSLFYDLAQFYFNPEQCT
jgi:hypothetical protein